MKILFIHQNFPGQFKHLAAQYAKKKENEVVFITLNENYRIPNVQSVVYKLSRKPSEKIHHYLVGYESALLYGQAVARACHALREKGFTPDVIVGHCGWGETLFVKDIYPDTPLLNYFEFFYHSTGADVGFDGEEPSLDTHLRLRIRNSTTLQSLNAGTWGLSPTLWQHSLFPEVYKDRISVIHEGVNTKILLPDDAATFTLDDGTVLKKGQRIVTYMARNLEPYRGFHIFVKALERMCKELPKDTQFLIIGGDEVSYGRRPEGGKSWREVLLKDITYDKERVHFLGRVPYGRFMDFLKVSSAHIYLTYPFVLSWSMLEAMASECLLIASSTHPVTEVLEHEKSGLLVDFFSPDDIVARVSEALEHPERYQDIRKAARKTVVDNYDLDSICLPRQYALIDSLAKGETPRLWHEELRAKLPKSTA